MSGQLGQGYNIIQTPTFVSFLKVETFSIFLKVLNKGWKERGSYRDLILLSK